MTPLRHDPIERDAPTAVEPPQGPYEVWALADDGATRLLVTTDEAHAQTTFRKHGHAVARGGVVLRFDVNLKPAQQRVLKHAVKHAPAPETAPETTPTPPAENPAAHEDPVSKKTETKETTETSACIAKDCDNPSAAVRADTHEDLVDFCAAHRQRTYERAGRWKVSLAVAARTVREGTSERPPEAPTSRRGQRDTKPSKGSQSAKKAGRIKALSSQSPVATLASAITSRLGGLSEDDVRRIAHEVVQEELRKLAEAIG